MTENELEGSRFPILRSFVMQESPDYVLANFHTFSQNNKWAENNMLYNINGLCC